MNAAGGDLAGLHPVNSLLASIRGALADDELHIQHCRDAHLNSMAEALKVPEPAPYVPSDFKAATSLSTSGRRPRSAFSSPNNFATSRLPLPRRRNRPSTVASPCQAPAQPSLPKPLNMLDPKLVDELVASAAALTHAADPPSTMSDVSSGDGGIPPSRDDGGLGITTNAIGAAIGANIRALGAATSAAAAAERRERAARRGMVTDVSGRGRGGQSRPSTAPVGRGGRGGVKVKGEQRVGVATGGVKGGTALTVGDLVGGGVWGGEVSERPDGLPGWGLWTGDRAGKGGVDSGAAGGRGASQVGARLGNSFGAAATTGGAVGADGNARPDGAAADVGGADAIGSSPRCCDDDPLSPASAESGEGEEPRRSVEGVGSRRYSPGGRRSPSRGRTRGTAAPGVGRPMSGDARRAAAAAAVDVATVALLDKQHATIDWERMSAALQARDMATAVGGALVGGSGGGALGGRALRPGSAGGRGGRGGSDVRGGSAGVLRGRASTPPPGASLARGLRTSGAVGRDASPGRSVAFSDEDGGDDVAQAKDTPSGEGSTSDTPRESTSAADKGAGGEDGGVGGSRRSPPTLAWKAEPDVVVDEAPVVKARRAAAVEAAAAAADVAVEVGMADAVMGRRLRTARPSSASAAGRGDPRSGSRPSSACMGRPMSSSGARGRFDATSGKGGGSGGQVVGLVGGGGAGMRTPVSPTEFSLTPLPNAGTTATNDAAFHAQHVSAVRERRKAMESERHARVSAQAVDTAERAQRAVVRAAFANSFTSIVSAWAAIIALCKFNCAFIPRANVALGVSRIFRLQHAAAVRLQRWWPTVYRRRLDRMHQAAIRLQRFFKRIRAIRQARNLTYAVDTVRPTVLRFARKTIICATVRLFFRSVITAQRMFRSYLLRRQAHAAALLRQWYVVECGAVAASDPIARHIAALRASLVRKPAAWAPPTWEVCSDVRLHEAAVEAGLLPALQVTSPQTRLLLVIRQVRRHARAWSEALRVWESDAIAVVEHYYTDPANRVVKDALGSTRVMRDLESSANGSSDLGAGWGRINLRNPPCELPPRPQRRVLLNENELVAIIDEGRASERLPPLGSLVVAPPPDPEASERSPKRRRQPSPALARPVSTGAGRRAARR